MEILSEKISESRNSCSVRVGGVGVEDMVWASRTWCRWDNLEYLCDTEEKDSMYSFIGAATRFEVDNAW